jgi:ATP-dependent Clp protease ATP-binding subunit ClpA
MRLPSVEDMDNPDRFTDKAVRALRSARRLAWERHHPDVAPEHLLLALAQMEPNVAQVTQERLEVNLTQELDNLRTLAAVARPEAFDGEPSAGPA